MSAATKSRTRGGVHAFAWLAAMAGVLCLMWVRCANAGDEPPAERPIHRYLRVAISPNAVLVASVEGDSPIGGFYPPIRDLVIRRIDNGAATTIALPCGRTRQCWPDSPAWSPDSSRVTFALRTPGSHARSIYSVAADGSGLVKLLDFGGTIQDLRYGPDGRLAMLATANALKEVGATEAGVPVAGDLDTKPPEQRIAILDAGALRWASPPDLFVYEYDWRPAGRGFVGTASPGNGDDNWWTAKLYAFSEQDATARIIYSPATPRQQ
ncbi:MAG: TolB family protein, partial [Steroidobacteraceae bacterium]